MGDSALSPPVVHGGTPLHAAPPERPPAMNTATLLVDRPDPLAPEGRARSMAQVHGSIAAPRVDAGLGAAPMMRVRRPVYLVAVGYMDPALGHVRWPAGRSSATRCWPSSWSRT